VNVSTADGFIPENILGYFATVYAVVNVVYLYKGS